MYLELEIKFYSQKGEGVAFYNEKPVYIKGSIINELIYTFIYLEEKNFYKGRIVKIIKKSDYRILNIPKLHYLIGGYELLHMNNESQKSFKINRVKNDFKKIANTEINNLEIVQGEKLLRYRNKITLHDGCFYFNNTKHKIKLDDFLLSEIKPKTTLKGEVIIRKLNTQIEGIENSNKKIYTYDNLNGINFRINLNSFYQVNKEIASKIYSNICDFIRKKDIVLDLYSGIGTITLLVAKKAKNVIGVEKSSLSVKDAIFNQKNNHIKNVEFINDKVFNFLQQDKNFYDVIVVDPARKGIDKKVLELIITKKPNLIIYLSCNPGTQAANFNILKENYKIKYIKIYDMFPQTYHIENLLVLEKIN